MIVTDKNDVLLKLQRYCAYQDRCSYEIEKKLFDLHVPEDWHADLLESLRKDLFLDDERYVSSFVSGKMNLKKWGRLKIMQALKSKKISQKLIDQVFLNLDEQAEQKNLMYLAEKKMKSISEPDPYKRKIKVFRFLQQKGYSFEQITRSLNDLNRSL